MQLNILNLKINMINEKTIRPWGKYNIISKTKFIIINPNQSISLQYHKNRDEFWRIIEGAGIVEIDNKKFNAKQGDTFTIPRTTQHRISTKFGIKFIEVATGDVDENDIIRLEDIYNRETKDL